MEINRFVGLATFLYALANPVGVIPIFLSLTEPLKAHRTRLILVASGSVAALLCVSALAGEQVLSFFNVGLDDFRIAGGLLALFIAFEMFQAHYGGIMQTREEQSEAESHIHEIAVTPLAFPLLIGPAEMSVMITKAADAHSSREKIALIMAGVLTAALIATTLFCAVSIKRFIGKTGINVATRIMALVVAAIGINFIFTGIRSELPGLAS